jgi:formiminoglutamate deiminase
VSAYHCDLAVLPRGVEADVLVEADGARITSVRAGGPAPPDAMSLEGLVIPGMANAHSHAFHRALRGRTQSRGGTEQSFWSWRERMYELAERLDPDSYRDLARATYGEMVLAGVTAVGEFHYLHHDGDGRPYEDPNAMGRALIEAAGEAGLRITLLDTCYLHGGIGVKAEGPQRRFSDGDASAWAERAGGLEEDPRSRIGAAIHSVRAVDPESARVVARWAEERAAPLHAHVSEQPAENDACFEAYGATPTAVLSDAGALGERFTAVHATHLSRGDVGILGSARATCCLCPTTERDLADGIGPARSLAGAGARLSLGTDSHALIDLFEEARAVELDQRLLGAGRGIHAPEELLEAATGAGHACLGWPEAGRIEEGALCDLVAVDLGSARLAGADRDDLVAAVVFAAAAADVRDVVVGGEPVVHDGRHLRMDVPAELERTIGALS